MGQVADVPVLRIVEKQVGDLPHVSSLLSWRVDVLKADTVPPGLAR